MSKYTITADYGATGEGMTYYIMFLDAPDKKSALERFQKKFGGYYTMGAEIVESFDFTSRIADILVPDAVERIMKDGGHFYYDAQFHMNFS